jgi:hypothetical protein
MKKEKTSKTPKRKFASYNKKFLSEMINPLPIDCESQLQFLMALKFADDEKCMLKKEKNFLF